MVQIISFRWFRGGTAKSYTTVTAKLSPAISGRLFLIPSRIKAGEMIRVLREGYEVSLLNDRSLNLVGKLSAITRVDP